MIDDKNLRKYMFDLMLENGFEVVDIIDFGRTNKENEYIIACTTEDEDNDLICYFEAKEEDGKTKISNIKVF